MARTLAEILEDILSELQKQNASVRLESVVANEQTDTATAKAVHPSRGISSDAAEKRRSEVVRAAEVVPVSIVELPGGHWATVHGVHTTKDGRVLFFRSNGTQIADFDKDTKVRAKYNLTY